MYFVIRFYWACSGMRGCTCRIPQVRLCAGEKEIQEGARWECQNPESHGIHCMGCQVSPCAYTPIQSNTRLISAHVLLIRVSPGSDQSSTSSVLLWPPCVFVTAIKPRILVLNFYKVKEGQEYVNISSWSCRYGVGPTIRIPRGPWRHGGTLTQQQSAHPPDRKPWG